MEVTMVRQPDEQNPEEHETDLGGDYARDEYPLGLGGDYARESHEPGTAARGDQYSSEKPAGPGKDEA